MAEFTVTVQELTKQAEELRSLKSQFVTAVEQLMSTEGALNGMWEGDAREAFHAAFTSDSNQMNNFATAIENYCIALENLATRYAQAENQNMDTAVTRTYK